MIRIEMVDSTLELELPKHCDVSVIESQVLKDLNGSNLPFIVFTDINGQNVIINKNNICSIMVKVLNEK